MLTKTEMEIKNRLMKAKSNQKSLTAPEKKEAKRLISLGFSKKAIKTIFSCSYRDLK